jgi:hypothetical protein
VPSPEGDVRQIALDAVPVDVLESIEVSKAILPDMEADAIGGMVNLITKRAPDALLFTVEGASGYAQIREEVGGNGAVTFGRRIANGKFGFLLNGSYYRRFITSTAPGWLMMRLMNCKCGIILCVATVSAARSISITAPTAIRPCISTAFTPSCKTTSAVCVCATASATAGSNSCTKPAWKS